MQNYFGQEPQSSQASEEQLQELNQPQDGGFSSETPNFMTDYKPNETEQVIQQIANEPPKTEEEINYQEYGLNNMEEYNLMVDVKEQGGSQEDFQYILEQTRQEQAPQVEQPIEEDKQGLDVGLEVGKGLSDFGKDFKFESNVDDGVVMSGLKFLGNLPGNTVQLAGDLIGIASNPVGTVQSVGTLGQTLVEKGLNKAFSTDVGQSIGRSIGFSENKLEQIRNDGFFTTEEKAILSDTISKEMGRIADEPGRIKELLVENPTDVLLTITGGLGVAKNVAKAKNMTSLAEKIGQLEKITNPITLQKEALKLGGKAIGGTTKTIGEGLGKTYVKTTGVNYDTVKNIVKNPELFKLAEKGNITARGIAEKAKNVIDKRIEEVGLTGKEYGNLIKNKVIGKADEVKNIFTEAVSKYEPKHLTREDLSVIKKAENYINQYEGQLTDLDIHSLRQQLDSILYKDGSKIKLSKNGGFIVNNIRKGVDDIAKTKIKGLKELDAKYGPEIQELKKIKELIYKKDGSLKDGYIGEISRLTGKNKELKIDRLKKIFPGIEDQINAFKAVQDVELAKGVKVGTYMNATSVGAGALLGGIPGAIGTYIATHPATLVKILQAYTGSKAVINGMVNKLKKGIKFTKEESNILIKALKEQALEKGGKLADDLADKVGARAKFIDDSGFKIHYGNKSIKDLSKIDDIDLFYEGMPKGMPEITYELKNLNYPKTEVIKDIFSSPNSKVISEYGKEYGELRNILSKYEKEFIDFNKTGNWEDFYTKMKQLEGVTK